MAERRRPQTTTLVAVGCLLAAAAVAVVWWLGEDDTEAEFCTATAAVDPPSASDPDAAFAAWFDDQGEEVSEHWRTTADADVDPAGADDYSRTQYLEWSWYLDGDSRVKVQMEEVPKGTFTVTAVNLCRSG